MPPKTRDNPAPRGTKWTWLLDMLRSSDEVTFRAADHGLEPSQRDLGRISGTVRNHREFRYFRWSIRAFGENITVKKMGQLYETFRVGDGQPPSKTTPYALLVRPDGTGGFAGVKALESLRGQLEDRQAELQRDIDAIDTTIELLMQHGKAVDP